MKQAFAMILCLPLLTAARSIMLHLTAVFSTQMRILCMGFHTLFGKLSCRFCAPALY